MASLKQYIKENQDKIQKINESVDNNIYLINEDQFVIEYGKEIDNLLNKFGKYTYNNIYNPYYIQESTNNKLSLNESEAVKNLLVFICEDYKRTLLQELDIYENLLNGNESVLNESLLNEGIIDNIKNTWNQGKEKVKQAYEAIKTKIKEVNQLIKDFAIKAINTVKEMAAKLIALLEKFNCTIKELFVKMGFDADKEEESVNKIADELAKNPETLKKNDAYDFKSETNESFEQYAHYLTQINEDIFRKKKDKEENKDANPENSNGETVKQAEKKSTKQMLWSAFKQFMIWAGVCVVIPGIVCAAFPGTFIALLVPLACKLAWNGYKIVKIWKQWQKVKKEWHTYSKVQKWITVIGMIASIIALAINFNSLIGDSGKILSAFKDNGCNLLAKANIGVQPDALTRGFAAFIKMISEGKFSMDDFGSAFKEITDSFAEHTDLMVEKVAKSAGKVGQSVDDIMDKFEGSKIVKSVDAWKKIFWPNQIPLDKIPDGSKITVAFDGVLNSSKTSEMVKWFSDHGFDMKDHLLNGFNDTLHKVCSNAGAVYAIKDMPAELWKEFLNSGVKVGHNGISAVLSATTDVVSNVMKDIVTAATSMLTTIPSVEYAFQNNGGFQVRLGTEEDKFVYEVGKDGVKKEEAADHTKEVEKITNIIKDTNNAYYKKLKEELKDAEESKKKDIENKLKIFQKNFEKINNRADVIIFYGTNVSVKESLSLKDFIMINESKNNKAAISKNIDIICEIQKLICTTYNVEKIDDIDSTKLEGKLKEFYDKYIIKWKEKINNLNKELQKQNIEWCHLDGKLALNKDISGDNDTNDTREKYKNITRALTLCGHDDLIKQFDILKNTAEKVEQTDNNDNNLEVFEKIFKGEELSDDDIKKAKDYLTKKFSNLSDDDLSEIISKINDLAKEIKDDEVKESLEYEHLLILEGITNKNILTSLDNIRKWLALSIGRYLSSKKYRNNNDFETYKDDKGNEQTKAKSSDLVGKLNKVFSKDKFNVPNLDKDFIRDIANIVDRYLELGENGYDDSAELIVSIHKLYTICSQQNKDIKDDNKDKNNDITNEQKLLYNHIIDILSKSKDFKKDLDNKEIDILKPIKIKQEEKEDKDFQNTVEQVKKELKNEKPSEDKNKDQSTKDIIASIEKISKDSEDKSNNSDDDLLEIYKKIIKALSKDKQFKDDVKDNQYELLPGVNIEESYRSLKSFIISEASELTKSDFSKNLEKLKKYLLEKIKALVKKDNNKGEGHKSGEIQKSDEKHEIIPFTPVEAVKSMGLTYKPKEVQRGDNVIAGELPPKEPIRQLPVLPSSQDNQDNQNSQDSDNKQNKQDDGKEKPILMIAYNYVIDLNNSDKNGPRKEVFTLKNIDENYEFIEIKKGTSKENISIMLGDILKTQTEYLRGFTILNPCNDKDSEDFKTIGNENTEREDFGKLTNGEITDIMNKPKKAKKYIFGNKSKKVTAAETEKEKETEEERAKKNVEAIKKDEKALQAAKKINPNISDDKGNINDEELEKTSQELATWQLGKHKNKSKKGFWNKIKNAFKSVFGSDEDDEKYKELNHIIANESLIFNNDFDLFEELEIPRYKSLKDYILEK